METEVAETWFPIRVHYVRTQETVVHTSPKEVRSGEEFRVLATRVKLEKQ